MKPALWKALAAVTSIGAAVAARKAVTTVWQQQVGHEPPVNPADPETDWVEALAWTAATGVLIGVARLVARRGAAKVWEKVDGQLPPGLHEAV